MNLSLLAPAFLAGLALLAVPLLIHLIQRQRGKVVHFPSLMFLRQVPFRSERRRRIRNWPLFLLRCAALILLALAFSRPLIERATAAVGSGELPREVVILVDRSYSMAFGGRWERALDAARSAIDELRPDDRATLVFFADDAFAATRSTADRARLLAELDGGAPGHGGTAYAPPLTAAASVLGASEQPQLEAILITDFQRAAWERQRAATLPPGAVLTPIDVSGERPSAVAVTDVAVTREPAAGRERVTLSARLAALGDASPGEVQVSLELDGRAVESETVTLAANSSANATFPPFTLSEAFTRAVVRIGDAGGEVDVVAPFRFALTPGGALGVLVLESQGAPPTTSLYLERALAIGERPGFRATTKSVSALNPGDLDGIAAVVLNDAPFPGGEAGAALRRWIEEGGGLLVALGERSGPAVWTDAVAALLPAPPGEPVDRDARGAALTFLDHSHPVFEAFAGPRTGDFSAARFFRYRRLPVSGDSSEVSVLARFDDSSPALVERRVGEGRVVVWASTLDSFWNDLPLQPVFLPFVHQLGTHLGGHRETSLWSSVGEAVDLSRGALAGRITAGTAPGDIVAVAPSGERVPVDPARPFLVVREAGFYELRETEEVERRPVVAVNPARAELELATFDPHELVAAATVAATEDVARAGTALPAADRERRQSLWWYILLAAFLLLASETVFSNRVRRRPRGSLIEESGS